VSLPGLPAGGATTGRSELRGLTQEISDRKALFGPAMRPETPLAMENSVGKLAAHQRRLMPAWERERGELPLPICPCPAARLGRDLLFLNSENPPPYPRPSLARASNSFTLADIVQ
jgi:hypothetical protein